MKKTNLIFVLLLCVGLALSGLVSCTEGNRPANNLSNLTSDGNVVSVTNESVQTIRPTGSISHSTPYPTAENLLEYVNAIRSALKQPEEVVATVNGETIYRVDILLGVASYKLNYQMNVNGFLPREESDREEYIKQYAKTDEQWFDAALDEVIRLYVTVQTAKKVNIFVSDEEVAEKIRMGMEGLKEDFPEIYQAELDGFQMSLEDYIIFDVRFKRIGNYREKYFEYFAENYNGAEEELYAAYRQHIDSLVSAAQIVKY